MFVPNNIWSNSTFTVGVDTALGSYTPETGSAWVTDAGAFSILASTDRLGVSTAVGGTAIDRAYVPTSNSDVRIATNMRCTGSNRYAGVVFRRVNASNYWRWEAYINNTTTGSRLVKVVADVSTVVQTVTGTGSTIISNVDTPVGVVLNGDNIRIFLNGTNIIDVTDATHNTGTGHGVCCNNSTTNAFWLDYRITDVDSNVLVKLS